MHLWQKYLGVENAPATFYHRLARKELVDLFTAPRRLVLEIGSSGGRTGQYCKEKFPGCQYWGFEMNRAAAAESAEFLDRVICGRFEAHDLGALGLKPRSVDGVVLGDVLEHTDNPWGILATLQPWLSDEAELVLSIPNVRNLWLMNEIAEGRFSYAENGLLDITHIRFFTLGEIVRMLQETGYEAFPGGVNIDERLFEYFKKMQGVRGPCTFNYGSVSVRGMGEQAMEFCARQFVLRARPSREIDRALLGPWGDAATQMARDIDASAEAHPDFYVDTLPPAPQKERIPTKLFAFYLPQFHPTPENSAWWGEGFTEWSNVARARPLFAGHEQPRQPGELGYYDLRAPHVMARQVELARQAGLEGFIFYHYWFSGKKMLSMPLEQYMKRWDELRLPFMVMWCNENWTRTWVDKREHADNILLAHQNLPDDPQRLIDDLLPIFRHPGYYRIDGRPVFLVYPLSGAAGALPLAEVPAVVQCWRERARAGGAGELLIGGHEKFNLKNADGTPVTAQTMGVDFLFEFPPNASMLYRPGENAVGVHQWYGDNTARVVHYKTLVRDMTAPPPQTLLRTVLAGSWDNTARRGTAANIFPGCTPPLYESWLRHAAKWAQEHPAIPGHPMTFINAWNEWAEGVYLEADRRCGYALLAATQRVAFGVHGQ